MVQTCRIFPGENVSGLKKAEALFFTLAVRETGVSRHHGGPIEGLPETPVHHRTIILFFTDYYLLFFTLAVRETGVSRHHGGPIEGRPESPRTSQHYHLTKGFPACVCRQTAPTLPITYGSSCGKILPKMRHVLQSLQSQ